MPISRQEMQRGRTTDSLSDRVLAFLNLHRDQAYTSREIADALGTPERPPDTGGFDRLLYALELMDFKKKLDSWAAKGFIAASTVQTRDGGYDTYYSSK